VLKPVAEHSRYDLVFEIGDRLLRVQCKWAPLRDGVIPVRLMSSRYKPNGQNIRVAYSVDEIDAVAAYCENLDRCYLIPVARVAEMRGFQLRLDPPLNGQRASLNWAADYEFPGL
jgi:hypothetical protein